jgi:hypothetical protein
MFAQRSVDVFTLQDAWMVIIGVLKCLVQGLNLDGGDDEGY